MTPVRGITTLFLALVTLSACNGEIYVRDGVTDGDMFHVAPFAATNPDPVVQSWIRYSLSRSVCQLSMDTDNPARASSFDCEQTARRQLVEAWDEKTFLDGALADAYLDDLSRVNDAGYIDEYVAYYFGKRQWSMPGDLDMAEFHRWRRDALSGHRAETRIVGSWSYRIVAAE